MRHKAKKLTKGKYEYRGLVIERDPGGSPGYWGSWNVYSGLRKIGTDSLSAGKMIADRIIEEREDK